MSPESEKTTEMFKTLVELFQRFIYFEDSALYILSAIYVLLTYLYDVFDEIPYLHIHGLKGSGKSRLADLFEGVCFNSFNSSEISEAALYREIESRHGDTTMIIDEADDLGRSSRRKALLSILRSGYRRNGNVTRCRSNGNIVRFATFCPKIIINEKGIQDSALESRTIPIHMIKSPDFLKTFRFSKLQKEFKEIKELINLFAGGYRDMASDYYNEQIEKIQGRDEELWAPIFIITLILHEAGCSFISGSKLKDNITTLAEKITQQRRETQLIGNLDAQILDATLAYMEEEKPLAHSDGLYVGEQLCKFIKESLSIPGLKLDTVSRILKRHNVITAAERRRLNVSGKTLQRTCYQFDKEKLSKLTDEFAFNEK